MPAHCASASSMLPPTATTQAIEDPCVPGSQIGLQNSAPPTAPSSGMTGFGLCLPGVSCRGKDEVAGVCSPQGREGTRVSFAAPTAVKAEKVCHPPTSTLIVTQEGPCLNQPVQTEAVQAHNLEPPPQLSIPSRQEVLKSALPGVASRQEVTAQPVAPTLGIPSRTQASSQSTAPIIGISSRQHEAQHFFTATPLTPFARQAGRKKTGPVPLKSLRSNASLDESGERPMHFPWGRSKSSGGLSGDFPNISPTSSLGSSFNSAQLASKQMTSITSFRWAPEHALVQCWHKALSDTYQDYNMVNIIGEGRHGAVFIVQHKITEQYRACKLLHKADHNSSTILNELETLRKLDHPNIVRLYEVNEDSKAVFLLMEFCDGGDLFSLIDKSEDGCLPESQVKMYSQQMLSALAYCHELGIVHRDVKPENFLLVNQTQDSGLKTLKLADFGIATSLRSSDIEIDGQVNGSIPYMAPELFGRRWQSLVKDSKGDRHILAAGDLWSCGVVIYVMLSGDLPYGDNPDSICSGDPPDFSSKVWNNISPEAQDLIQKLLDPSIEERFTAKEALQHEWFLLKNGSPLENFSDHGLHWPASEQSEGSCRADLARVMLRSLRRWKPQPFLRRMAIAGVAKRLEADNTHLRFADAAFHSFKGSAVKLTNDLLVQELNNALCDAMAAPLTTSSFSTSTPFHQHSIDMIHPFQAAEGGRSSRSSASLTSGTSLGSFSPGALGSKTLTGLHVRQHVNHFFRKLGRLSEETPAGSSPVSQSPGIVSVGSEDLVSLTELRALVGSLDGMKNGTVDYTLFVAALIPPEVYCEEARALEVFSQLDLRRSGQISPEDLQASLSKAVRSKDSGIRKYTSMVKDFDFNGDGCLDFQEFRKMLAGDEHWVEGDSSATASVTPMATPPSKP